MDWGAFLSAFGLVFVAELGDKTQLAVFGQACKYRRPWPVFVGAALALMAVTAIGVAGGGLLARLLPRQVLRLGAALGFVVAGLLVARSALWATNSAPDAGCDPEAEAEADCSPTASGWNWQAFGSTFGLLLVAELGDKTQLAVLSLSGQSQAPWSVFAGATLALITVTAVGVAGGEGLSRLLPERALLWLSALMFVSAGVWMGMGIWSS